VRWGLAYRILDGFARIGIKIVSKGNLVTNAARLITDQAINPTNDKDNTEIQNAQIDEEKPFSAIGNLVTDQPPSLITQKVIKLTEDQHKVIILCKMQQTQAELMKALGMSHRIFFKRTRLDPLIKANLIRMTYPNEPNHPDQAYVVTGLGQDVLASFKEFPETAEE
jgi:DNA-binding HxlR family transcriptional regulator